MAKKVADPDEPKKKTIYTIKLDENQMMQLKDWCQKNQWKPYDVDYAHFGFKGDKVNVVGYQSGKVVVQGKKTEEFVQFVIEAQITHMPEMGYDEVHHPEWFEPHLGVDESGKGDLFGPLVSTCVIADGSIVRQWQKDGIRESKSVSSDSAVLKMEQMILRTKGVVVKSTFVGMLKYNELYEKFANLNKLLAWMHSKSVKEALTIKHVPWGMLDQFTKQPLVQNYLKEIDDFELKMQTKAEADPVVAAASIIARATYIRQLGSLGKRFGEPLKKGSGALVKTQARELIAKLGPEVFPEFAKMHFKTATEALN